MEAHYPSRKRNFFRYCVSLPTILLSLGVVCVSMFCVFEFQDWVNKMENPPKPLKFAPKVALAVVIGMLDDNYKKIAYKLNDKGGQAGDTWVGEGWRRGGGEGCLLVGAQVADW